MSDMVSPPVGAPHGDDSPPSSGKATTQPMLPPSPAAEALSAAAVTSTPAAAPTVIVPETVLVDDGRSPHQHPDDAVSLTQFETDMPDDAVAQARLANVYTDADILSAFVGGCKVGSKNVQRLLERKRAEAHEHSCWDDVTNSDPYNCMIRGLLVEIYCDAKAKGGTPGMSDHFLQDIQTKCKQELLGMQVPCMDALDPAMEKMVKAAGWQLDEWDNGRRPAAWEGAQVDECTQTILRCVGIGRFDMLQDVWSASKCRNGFRAETVDQDGRWMLDGLDRLLGKFAAVGKLRNKDKQKADAEAASAEERGGTARELSFSPEESDKKRHTRASSSSAKQL